MKTQKVNKVNFVNAISEKILNGQSVTAGELKLYAKFTSEASTKEAGTKKASTKKASTKKASTKKASTKKASTKKASTKKASTKKDIYVYNLEKNGYNLNEVQIIDYNDKCIGIFGDTKSIKDTLFGIGAKFNRFLKNGQNNEAGFIISRKLMDKKQLFKALQNFEPETILQVK